MSLRHCEALLHEVERCNPVLVGLARVCTVAYEEPDCIQPDVAYDPFEVLLSEFIARKDGSDVRQRKGREAVATPVVRTKEKCEFRVDG